MQSTKMERVALIRCSICALAKPGTHLFISSTCTHSFCHRCISKHVTSKLQESITGVECPDTNCDAIITPHVTSNQFFITPNCTHPSFCNPCISKYVTTRLQEKVTRVECPDTKCNEIITPDDCKGVVLEGVLLKWERAMLKFCSICAHNKPPNQFFIGPNCTHSFCSLCISKYVTAKIEENITRVKCPDTNCEGTISPGDCKGVVPTRVVERWETVLIESMLLGSESTLYCPFKDCSSLLINDKVMAGSAECPSHRLFCTECKVGWHAGLNCAEFQSLRVGDRDEQDLLTVKHAKEMEWRRCPNCSFYVDKISGCLHITCRCSYEFCYRCGAKWIDHACA